MRVKIKICGIKTPDMAVLCAEAGADYIGIVLHPESPRYVDLDTAVLIAQSAKKANIIPVAVFVDQDSDAILSFCKLAKIDHVQLHGDNARQALPYLPESIHKIYVPPSLRAERSKPGYGAQYDIEPGLLRSARNDEAFANNYGDYLLFDSQAPGTGQVIDWTNIHPPKNIPFFLAGGLNVHNVKEAITLAKPYAVDVSSGVESSRGEKNTSMIIDFIKQVQHVE